MTTRTLKGIQLIIKGSTNNLKLKMLAHYQESQAGVLSILHVSQSPEYGEDFGILLIDPNRNSPADPWVYAPGTPRYRRLRRVPRVLADSGWEDNSATSPFA